MLVYSTLLLHYKNPYQQTTHGKSLHSNSAKTAPFHRDFGLHCLAHVKGDSLYKFTPGTESSSKFLSHWLHSFGYSIQKLKIGYDA